MLEYLAAVSQPKEMGNRIRKEKMEKEINKLIARRKVENAGIVLPYINKMITEGNIDTAIGDTEDTIRYLQEAIELLRGGEVSGKI
jgi:hypothetical protein